MVKVASTKEVGHRIRSTRVAMGLSLAGLAEKVRTDKGTISRIERGTAGLNVERLQRIAHALNVSPGDLLRTA